MASQASQAGVLTVLFENAKDLDNVKYPSPQNPFCIISIGDEKEETNPRVNSKTTPVWFETRTLNVKNETEFSVEVYHYSDGDGESKFIGSGKGDLTQVRAQGWDREQQVAMYSRLGHRYGFVQVTLQFSEKDPWERLPMSRLSPSSQRALAASTLKSIAWEQFSKMGEGEREVWKQAFDGMDSDKNGTLSVEEVYCVLTPIFSNHNIKPSPQGIIGLFHFLDTDGDRKLDFEEMVAMRTIFNSPICQCCLKWTLSDNVWACRDCCTEHLLTPDIERDGSKWVTFCAECKATQPGKTCCPFSTSHRLEAVPNGSLLGLEIQDWGWSQQLTTEEQQQQQQQQRRQQQQQQQQRQEQQQQQQVEPRSEDVAPSQVTTSSEENECVICMEAKSNTGFLHGDSMHKCVCTDCSKKVPVEAPCPLCQVPVERIIAVFTC